MFISACILTKNNEDTIGLAISSLKNHVDRVIVADTGSDDSTVLIASELGAEIHSFSWCDDFSKARNFCLQIVRNDNWVLWLDSDEEFVWSNDVSFKGWLQEKFFNSTDVLLLEVRHIRTGEPQEVMALTHAERLFSPMFFRYTGSVHENITCVSEDGFQKTIQYCPYAWIIHSGYSPEFQERKHQRNMALLKNELTENPSNPLTFRYIANEAYNFGDYTQSLLNASKALELIPLTGTYSRAQSYFYSIMSNVHLNKTNEAQEMIERCVAELPHYSDPYCIAGELCFSQSLWEEALKWYDAWFDSVKQEKEMFPDYFISQRKQIYKRRQELYRNLNGSISMKEVKDMNLSILITYPELEFDWEELILHIKEKLRDVNFHIGVWCDQKFQVDQKIKLLWRENKIQTFYEADWQKTVSSFVKKNNTQYLWKWEANERLTSDFNLETFIHHINNYKNEVVINRFSERVGCTWQEKRIWDVSHTEYNDFRVETNSLYNGDNYHENMITLEKPLMVPKERQKDYSERVSMESGFNRMLTNFGCQRYEEVIKQSTASEEDFWISSQFFKALAYICLEQIDQAANIVYDMIDNDLTDKDVFDFIYLHSKLAQNVTVDEMKKESIQLLTDVLESNPIIETKHLKILETHWWAQMGELYWQIGDADQAIKSFRQSLEVSSFKNLECAYRLVEVIQMQFKDEGIDTIVRTILGVFQDSPNGKSVLGLMFEHLNLQDWALLFKREDITTALDISAIEKDNLVSIILPVYNDTQYLSESIRSILSQSYVNLELIIIDDGSTVDVKKYVDRYKYDSRIKYFRTKNNSGIPSAINYGITKAVGSIMAWTSADNFTHSRWVEKMVLRLESEPTAVAAYSSYYHVDEDGIIIGTKKEPYYKLNGLQNSGPSFFWRTNILRKSGVFDESLFGIEDRDFAIRIALQGKIIYHSEPLYYYRIHEGSLSSKIELGSHGGWNELHEKLKKKWIYLSFV
ncbi:glycosyltransferase [Paenibacillus sp. F6_3S_P_1C]|uniref:Glycosyltransferase n=1 Tax=Paenibacillus vandeheii TaxID=3035917 RepID=A0ABT8JF62_9BACL|nr:glycosyltransferase [Paenibacillus vandeheii]MDN4603744.1 glycosyltransferase [Paenibacillus vandeheii]